MGTRTKTGERGEGTDQKAEPGDVGEGGGDGGGGEREHAGEVPHHHVGGDLNGVLRQVHHHHGQGQVPDPPGLARPPPPPLLVLLRRPRRQQQRPRLRGLILLPRGGHLGLGRPRPLSRSPHPRRLSRAARVACHTDAQSRTNVSSMCGWACDLFRANFYWAKEIEFVRNAASVDQAGLGTASTPRRPRQRDGTCQAINTHRPLSLSLSVCVCARVCARVSHTHRTQFIIYKYGKFCYRTSKICV